MSFPAMIPSAARIAAKADHRIPFKLVETGDYGIFRS
jgi:hypothetical protein